MARIAMIWVMASAVAAAEPGNWYPVLRPAVAPVIDGQVAGDPAWQTIPAATGFHVLGGGYAAGKQTRAYWCWDDQALYVAAVLEEPDAALLKPAVKDGGDTWLEDSIEVFVQPLPPTGATFQFGVTCGGAVGGFEGSPDIRMCRAAAKIGEDSYSVELRIPYQVIGAKPAAGARWRGTVCRNIFTTRSGGDKFTSWSPLKSRFFEPDNFGTLEYAARTATTTEAAELTGQINQAYRATLVTALHAAAKEGADYLPTLSQAAGSKRFGDQARKLVESWQEVAKLDQEADQAPVLEVRRVLARVQQLSRDSYTVKYQYLIDKLLSEA